MRRNILKEKVCSLRKYYDESQVEWNVQGRFKIKETRDLLYRTARGNFASFESTD